MSLLAVFAVHWHLSACLMRSNHLQEAGLEWDLCCITLINARRKSHLRPWSWLSIPGCCLGDSLRPCSPNVCVHQTQLSQKVASQVCVCYALFMEFKMHSLKNYCGLCTFFALQLEMWGSLIFGRAWDGHSHSLVPYTGQHHEVLWGAYDKQLIVCLLEFQFQGKDLKMAVQKQEYGIAILIRCFIFKQKNPIQYFVHLFSNEMYKVFSFRCDGVFPGH